MQPHKEQMNIHNMHWKPSCNQNNLQKSLLKLNPNLLLSHNLPALLINSLRSVHKQPNKLNQISKSVWESLLKPTSKLFNLPNQLKNQDMLQKPVFKVLNNQNNSHNKPHNQPIKLHNKLSLPPKMLLKASLMPAMLPISLFKLNNKQKPAHRLQSKLPTTLSLAHKVLNYHGLNLKPVLKAHK